MATKDFRKCSAWTQENNEEQFCSLSATLRFPTRYCVAKVQLLFQIFRLDLASADTFAFV